MFYLSCWWCQLNYTTTKNVFCHVKSPFLFNYMYVCKVGVYAFFLFMFFFIPFWHAWESHAFFGHFPSSHATLAKSHNSQLNSRLHIYKTHYGKEYSFLSSLIQWTIIFRIEAHWIQMWLWTSARHKWFCSFSTKKTITMPYLIMPQSESVLLSTVIFCYNLSQFFSSLLAKLSRLSVGCLKP